MRIEALSFRRCCCCIPLRYGLLAWGYCRLLVAGFLLLVISLGLKEMIERSRGDTVVYTISSVVIIILVADVVLGIVFIVGCHKKDPTLIKKYYYHNIFLLCVFIPLGLYSVGMTLHMLIKYEERLIDIFIYASLDLFTIIAYISLQVYIVLLIRSQFMKLTEGCQFRYENNAIEPGCSINIENLNRVKKEEHKEPDYNIIDLENGAQIKH